MVHLFTVNDLNHLYRGGRISRTTAVVGSMLNIKPVLHVDNDGKLTAIGKVRGRKKSLQELVKLMDEKIGSYHDTCHTIFISHGDCEEDANYVAEKVKEKYRKRSAEDRKSSALFSGYSGKFDRYITNIFAYFLTISVEINKNAVKSKNTRPLPRC